MENETIYFYVLKKNGEQDYISHVFYTSDNVIKEFVSTDRLVDAMRFNSFEDANDYAKLNKYSLSSYYAAGVTFEILQKEFKNHKCTINQFRELCGFEPIDNFSEHMNPPAFDEVNNPEHYASGKYECIDVMLDAFGKEKVMAFCHLNAFKYLWRLDIKHKESTVDAEKAKWYLEKYIELGNKED